MPLQTIWVLRAYAIQKLVHIRGSIRHNVEKSGNNLNIQQLMNDKHNVVYPYDGVLLDPKKE